MVCYHGIDATVNIIVQKGLRKTFTIYGVRVIHPHQLEADRLFCRLGVIHSEGSWLE